MIRDLLRGAHDLQRECVLNRLLAVAQVGQIINEAESEMQSEIGHILLTNSYVHENGFTKLTLIMGPDELLSLRLHHWTETVVDSASSPNIHTHCFHLHSHILKGVLEDVVWAPNETGEMIQHYIYTPPRGAASYSMFFGGRAFLREASRKRRETGDSYGHQAHVLHSSHPIGEVITLFLEDRRRAPDFAHVYTTRYPKQNFKITVPRMTPADYSQALARAREVLGLIG